MTLFETCILMSCIIPVALIIDCFHKKDPEQTFTDNQQLCDSVLLFAPFAALFYSDEFYTALALISGIMLIGCLLMLAAKRSGYLRHGPEMVYASGPGSLLLAIAGYYLFFHQGILSPDQAPSVIPVSGYEISAANYRDAPAGKSLITVCFKPGIQWQDVLPPLIYIITSICIFIWAKKRHSLAQYIMLPALLIFNLLPIFTNYYWWNMGLGFILYLALLNRVCQFAEISIRGGLGMILSYCYMLAAAASIFIYAILF